MSRPSLRRALRRAGVGPLPRGARPAGVPSPLVLLEGEEDGSGPVDLSGAFGRAAPTEMEIGSGKGRFLLESAAERPERNFLGAELEGEYARLARARAARRGLTNVRFERLDGKAFVRDRLAPGSLAALHVFFPDPWPKKRHRKRRLFDASFAAAAARALAPGAPLRVASDHLDYFAEIVEVLDAEKGLARVPESETGPWTSGTNYELKFLKEGRPIGRGIWRAVGPDGAPSPSGAGEGRDREPS